MERLVHIGFGQRDVILEASGDRLPIRMDDAQGLVTFAQGRHDNPKCDQVINLVETEFLLLHFAVDGKEMLGAAGNFRFDTSLF